MERGKSTYFSVRIYKSQISFQWEWLDEGVVTEMGKSATRNGAMREAWDSICKYFDVPPHTERDVIQAALKRIGAVEGKTLSSVDPDGGIVVEDGFPGWDGYPGFAVAFEFDKHGKLIKISGFE